MTYSIGDLDTPLESAWKNSFLSSLSTDEATALIEAAQDRAFNKGEELQIWDGKQIVLVVDGLLRVYLRSVDGKQATARYVRGGDTYGLALMFCESSYDASVEALTTSRILVIPEETLKRVITSSPVALQALIQDLSTKIVDQVFQLENNIFYSLRQKIAQHLIDLAVHSESELLIVSASHQDVANAVGTAREVAARILSQFQAEGIVQLKRKLIVIEDVKALDDSISTGF